MGNQQSSPITRRTIAKGIAWSVPAFALATAAPALAQSPLVTLSEGDVCKYPGNSGPTGTFQSYLFPVIIQNIANEVVCLTVSGAQVVLTGGTVKPGDPIFWTQPPGSPGAAPGGETVCLPIGGNITYWLVLTNTGNSSNSSGTVYVDLFVEGQSSGRSYEDQAAAPFATTPPECGDYVTTSEPVTPAASTTPVSEEARVAETTEPESDGGTTETQEKSATEPAASESSDGESSEPATSGAEGTEAETSEGSGTEEV
ncbi:hypothetical protein DXU92_10950 [Brachybacterium saurashtrense]|uniref:Uncharacterized protein n=1 Tax=Brachybacterium saurashtrense TaxID=556288 RepID=A0A345YNA9_9MICO|nr:hypothetical protein [Brachybacterium saurashtrense]AXK45411.1 hypothetical protein DWV08_07120 [Brachybacterium saurashtrense]RRR21832.1 hypothetical protein DXU92_10950 [Brachybacterium saurashtrense]